MAVTDDLNAAITALTFNAYNNAPISQLLINQLHACAAQLSPGAPLNQINDAISQLQFAAPNNAPASQGVIYELNNAWSALTNGPLTTNSGDLAAISGIANQILLQEPDWAPSLWMNWTSGTTTLTVQVRGFYTLTQVISASPWWSNWASYQDAATQIIAAIYLLQLSTQASMLMKANNAQSRDSSACSSC